MRIVVLTKPVPDPAAGAERLGPDHRLDRAASPTVINGNDEYALEAALQLVEAHGGEVVVLTMAPANGTETIRKALAMGAQRGILVTDEALAGADLPTTIRVLAAAVAGGVVRPAAGRPRHLRRGGWSRDRGRGRATRPARCCPPPGRSSRTRPPGAFVSTASPPGATTWSRRPCRQSSPAPRHSAPRATRRSRGSWRRGRGRSRSARCADLGVDLRPGRRRLDHRRSSPRTCPRRAPQGRVVSGPAPDMAREIADFLVARRII